MANELRVPLMLQYTGLTLLGKVYSATAQVGTDVAMSEIGSSAFYVGSISLAGVADGAYMVRYDTATKTYGYGDLYVLNETVVTPEQYALSATVADKIWDEVIDNANHNIAKSAGKRLRQAGTSLSAEGSVNDLTPTTTSFISNLTQANTSFYADQTCIFISGALEGQARVITSYDGATKTLTFDEPWTLAPSDGDEFEIKAHHIHPISEIQAGLATSAELSTTETNLTAQLNTIDTNLDTVKADLDDGGRIDLLIDAILEDTAAIATLNNLSAAQVNAEVDTALASLNDISIAQVDSTVATALSNYGVSTSSEVSAVRDLSAASAKASELVRVINLLKRRL